MLWYSYSTKGYFFFLDTLVMKSSDIADVKKYVVVLFSPSIKNPNNADVIEVKHISNGCYYIYVIVSKLMILPVGWVKIDWYKKWIRIKCNTVSIHCRKRSKKKKIRQRKYRKYVYTIFVSPIFKMIYFLVLFLRLSKLNISRFCSNWSRRRHTDIVCKLCARPNWCLSKWSTTKFMARSG